MYILTAPRMKANWAGRPGLVPFNIKMPPETLGGEECLHNLTTGDRGVKYIPVFLHVSLVVFGFSHCTSVYIRLFLHTKVVLVGSVYLYPVVHTASTQSV